MVEIPRRVKQWITIMCCWWDFRHLSFVAVILAILGIGPAAHAAVTITASQAGGNVTFGAAGSLDISGLGSSEAFAVPGVIVPSVPLIALGPTDSDVTVTPYFITTTPESFGSGGPFLGDTGAGLRWGVDDERLLLPEAYAGTSLASTLVFTEKDFSSLGITPGSYTWAWAADSVTLNVVPLPAALPLLGTALAGLGSLAWRNPRTATTVSG